jgi:uncharacterized delta-60 repeat protein
MANTYETSSGFHTDTWSGTKVLSTQSQGYGVTVDSSNNIYVTGDTSGGIILVKYNSSGTKQWTQQLGTISTDLSRGVTVDSSGNIYVSGMTYGALDNNTSSGSSDIFLVKYNSSGTYQWTQQLGTSNREFTYGMTIDSSDNIYITGMTEGNLVSTNSGNGDIFLVKYNSSGTRQWTQQLGGYYEEYGYGVKVDSSDNVYVTGFTSNDLDGNTNSGVSDIFLAKYYDNGTKQWTKLLGSTDSDIGYGVTVDSSDNVYVTGHVVGDIDGQSGTGDRDILLVKYNSGGTKIWTRLIGLYNDDYGYGVSVDSSDNIYVTGYLNGGSINGGWNNGTKELVIIKYNASGVKQWASNFDDIFTPSNEVATSITVDSSNNIYLTGYTDGDLDGNVLSGGTYLFLVKFNSDGVKQ